MKHINGNAGAPLREHLITLARLGADRQQLLAVVLDEALDINEERSP